MKSIFLGKIITFTYRLKRDYFLGSFVDYDVSVAYQSILTTIVDLPPFTKGDYVFLDNLNAECKIEKVVRSVEGYYMYDLNYVIKSIHVGKEKAEQELKEMEELKKRLEEEAEVKLDKRSLFKRLFNLK